MYFERTNNNENVFLKKGGGQGREKEG